MTITLYTDSQYVVNGIGKWITGWKKRGWITSDKKPVANEEQWLQAVGLHRAGLVAGNRLDVLNSQLNVTWRWIPGHAGNPENERADQLAQRGLAEAIEAKRQA